MDMLKFSLVTTCRNEISSLPRWQNDLLAQTRQPDEIVIVDAFSDDGTAQMLFEWADQDERVVVKQEKGAAAHGRNVAIEMSTHEWIASTDMGVRIDRRWFEEIVKPVEEDPTVDVVAGSYAVDKSTITTPAARAEYYIYGDGIPHLEPGFVVGNRSVVYKKSVWRELGGLPEDLTMYADDSVFGRQILQAGYKMAFAPDAMVYWARPKKLKEFWKELFGYGRGDGEAAIKMPYAFRLYLRGWVLGAFVPCLVGCRHLQKHISWKAITSALMNYDPLAIIYMPLLLFVRGYYFGKGYMIGYRYGERHCRNCRARVEAWTQYAGTPRAGRNQD